MSHSDDSEWRDRDAEGEDPDDEGEELEAMIEQADHAFGSESFGTTALEQEEGESLDDRLKEELPSRSPVGSGPILEDEGVPDEEKELEGEAEFGPDPFLAPEDAAVTVRRRAPGAVDHPDETVERVDDSWDEE